MVLKVKGWPYKEAIGAFFRKLRNGRIRKYTDLRKDEVEN